MELNETRLKINQKIQRLSNMVLKVPGHWLNPNVKHTMLTWLAYLMKAKKISFTKR